jgi:hypothetical protein
MSARNGAQPVRLRHHKIDWDMACCYFHVSLSRTVE